MIRLLASVLLIGLSASALAAEPITIRTGTAGELANACAANPKEPGADARINFCHGFAQGAITTQLRTGGDKKPFCFPNPAPKRTETMNEFVRWVRADGSRASLNSADGLFQFLAQRYPCP
ncbi:Rap1a/Tai family immunity protein [Rhodopila sp.]|uniref:Rap1a/Tai family immunity protein n=1 Tax=Rhodopila sp. TaxID=2480087 RepID=UPI002C934011|nr:Rap1a/Tai family immunity protein [Rhodopila sp.]HVZ07341.1 Rap1a/Tai family immunity protein [Rhodopila sp.]